MQHITVTPEQLDKVKVIELNMLKELDRLCRKHGIRYSLAGGTLLGAVRHKGFIPWDDDVDVLMTRRDYKRFCEVCRTELDPAYFYQSHETDPGYYRLYAKLRANNTVFKECVHATHDMHHGIFLDIFPADYTPVDERKRWWHLMQFRFYNTGLSAKYLVPEARTGKRRLLAKLLRIAYAPFTMEFLYRKAQQTLLKYAATKEKMHTRVFSSTYVERDCFPYGLFEEYTECEFEGSLFMVPIQMDVYLEALYGDYMKLPPEDKRVVHHDLVELKL